MKTLSIVIPVYNERSTIAEVLKHVISVVLPGWKKEIIVVDDGSSDGTQDVLKKWENTCRVVYKQKNEGKGSAVTEGFSYVRGDIVIIQDADLEYQPSDYPALLKSFENTQVNVVYGSRFLGAHLSTMFIYEVGNKFVTFMTNILFNTNITDMETGYKVFRAEVLKKVGKIEAKQFDFEPEVTAKLLNLGYQIYEVPISYFGRKFSEGKKLTWRDGIVALITLFKWKFLRCQ